MAKPRRLKTNHGTHWTWEIGAMRFRTYRRRWLYTKDHTQFGFEFDVRLNRKR